MFKCLIKALFNGIISILAIGTAMCIWFLSALLLEESFHYGVIIEMGLIIPKWYQIIVYYIIPISILLIITILAIKKTTDILRWALCCLMVVFIINGIYLGFVLPDNVALNMEKLNRVGHILSLNDMLGCILLNLLFLVVGSLIIWFHGIKLSKTEKNIARVI